MHVKLIAQSGEFNATLEQRQAYPDHLQHKYADQKNYRPLAKWVYAITSPSGAPLCTISIEERIVNTFYTRQLHTSLTIIFVDRSLEISKNQVANVFELVGLHSLYIDPYDNTYDLSHLTAIHLENLWRLLVDHELFCFPLNLVFALRSLTYPKIATEKDIEVYRVYDDLIQRGAYKQAATYATSYTRNLGYNELLLADCVYIVICKLLALQDPQAKEVAKQTCIEFTQPGYFQSNVFVPLCKAKLSAIYLEELDQAVDHNARIAAADAYLNTAAFLAIRSTIHTFGSPRRRYVDLAIEAEKCFGLLSTISAAQYEELLTTDFTHERFINDYVLKNKIYMIRAAKNSHIQDGGIFHLSQRHMPSQASSEEEEREPDPDAMLVKDQTPRSQGGKRKSCQP